MEKRIIISFILIFTSGCVAFNEKNNYIPEENFSLVQAQTKSIDVIIEPYATAITGEYFLPDGFPIKKALESGIDCALFGAPRSKRQLGINDTEAGALSVACRLNKSLKENLRASWSLRDESKSEASDIILHAKIQSEVPTETWRKIWFYSSVFTLGLIPTWIHTDIKLQILAYRKGETKPFKIYEASDGYQIVGQIVLIFALPFVDDANTVSQRAIDRVTKKIFIDISKDGILN